MSRLILYEAFVNRFFDFLLFFFSSLFYFYAHLVAVSSGVFLAINGLISSDFYITGLILFQILDGCRGAFFVTVHSFGFFHLFVCGIQNLITTCITVFFPLCFYFAFCTFDLFVLPLPVRHRSSLFCLLLCSRKLLWHLR